MKKTNSIMRTLNINMKCKKCGSIVVVDQNTKSVLCSKCIMIMDIQSDRQLSAELAKEEMMTRSEWEILIEKKEQQRISDLDCKRNVDIDAIVDKRNKKKNKEKTFVDSSVKKHKEKSKIKKKRQINE